MLHRLIKVVVDTLAILSEPSMTDRNPGDEVGYDFVETVPASVKKKKWSGGRYGTPRGSSYLVRP